jgi:putative lipoic acid-binding regulatory protein
MAADERETLIEFPCDFDIKAMGESSESFDALVVSIVRKHVDSINEAAVTTKQSSGGKYTSVTVTVYVSSQVQLDTIYQELSSHELIKYVL